MRHCISILILLTSLFYGSAIAANLNLSVEPQITTDKFPSANLPVTYPPDIARIIKRGTLIVAVINKDMPPFFELDKNGNLVGYDIALAENLAKQLGVNVQFHRGADSFDGVIDEVTQGHADVAISMLSITLPRALRVNYSQPYLYLPMALLYNRLLAAQLHYRNPVIDIADDPTVTLGVLDKSSYVDYIAQTYPRATVIKYADSEQARQDVLKGKIFGVYLSQAEAVNWLQRNPTASLYVNYGVVKKNDPIAIAVSWQDERLLNWINWYLVVIKQNGFETLLKQQFLEGNDQKNS